MTRLAACAVAGAGAIAIVGAAVWAAPPKNPSASTHKDVGQQAHPPATTVDLHLAPKWAPAPTVGTDPTGCSTWTGTGYIFEWAVQNTGTKASLQSQLILTCTVAGGRTWPAGQAAYLKDRLCTCNARTFSITPIPPGGTYGFNTPAGTRLQTYQGTYYVPCNDPNYPHAVVTAKVGSATATVPLCK